MLLLAVNISVHLDWKLGSLLLTNWDCLHFKKESQQAAVKSPPRGWILGKLCSFQLSCHALESFSWLLSSCLAGAFGRHVTCTLSSPVHPHLYLSHRGSPLTSSYWGRAPPHKQLYTEKEADRRAPGPIFGALRTHHIPGTVDMLWKQEHAVG